MLKLPITLMLMLIGVLSYPSINMTNPTQTTVKPDAELVKITDLVSVVQRGQGPKYAKKVATCIVTSARKYKISPSVVAATAYIESGFRMPKGPCIGMMQIAPGTARSFKKAHLNAYIMEDNIQMGACYLSRHYHKVLSSRCGNPLQRMWGRYNGAGPNSGYVRRAMKVYNRIEKGDKTTWRKCLKRGALWK